MHRNSVPDEWVATPFVDWKLGDEWRDLFHQWRFASPPHNQLHQRTIGQNHSKTQLARYSSDNPIDNEVKLTTSYMKSGEPYSDRTIFANQFPNPRNIDRPNRFVGFIHLDEIPGDLDWFIQQLKEFDLRHHGKARIQINPVKPPASSNSSRLSAIDDGGVLLANRQKKNEVFVSNIWASTHIILGSGATLDQNQPAWVTAYISRQGEHEHLGDPEHAARGCVNISVPEHFPDSDLILSGLRYLITQYNSYSNSLVFSHGDVQAHESPLNMLHALMYDPIAQMSFPEESEIHVKCAVDLLEKLPSNDTPRSWPGDGRSLWHLQHLHFLHAESEVLVKSFLNYVRKPCLELWDRFQKTFHVYSSLVQKSCIDLYTHQIRDLGGEIEQPFTFQNFTDQIEQLIHDYPDYFSPADDWNFGRLRNFSELNELVSVISEKVSASAHMEYQVLLCHIEFFRQLLKSISSQFKFSGMAGTECISLFVLGGGDR